MATVNLTGGFSDLDSWPGDLLDASGGAAINTKTATTFTFTYPPGHPFAGYSVTVKGSGFVYDGTEPTGGTMTGITFKDDTGATVLGISGLAAGTPASDLSLFYANVFGWDFPDGGSSGAQSKNAWSQILMGNDVINGTSGDDDRGFPGVNAGNDVFNMGDGNDWVGGGMGNDTINGGNGFDILSFDQTHWNEGIPMVRGVNANLATGVVLDPYGFTDRVTGVEGLWGSSYSDQLVGDDAGNQFNGGRGNDLINGAGGDYDWVLYGDDVWTGATRGINANLGTGVIRDGYGNTDTVSNVECISATIYNDTLVGSAGDNYLEGGAGRDSFDGKGGVDYVFFHGKFADEGGSAINVDLSRASGQIINDGYGNTENTVGIEGIVGSSFGDKIKGNAGANYIEGWDGKDTLTGGGGADQFLYWERDELDDADVIKDFNAAAGANQDVMSFYMSNIGASTTLKLVNGTAATEAGSTFIFDAATDTLYWDEDGTGATAKIAVAVLQGVNSLTAANFDLL